MGGAFRFELENGESIAGMYLEIRPPERLVFTWSGRVAQGGETVVRLDFLERDPLTTEVLLTHEGLRAPERRARARAGWASMLDALAEVLASPQRES